MVAITGVQNGKRWRLAPCLVNLVSETDKLYPNRRKISDGSIGDAAHAARTSDHNPGWDAVVSAVDITDDDKSGCNIRVLVDLLVKVRDRRVKYLIHEGQIVASYARPGIPAWTWSKYTGINGHFQHAHVSVLDTQLFADGLWWPIKTVPKPDPLPDPNKEVDDMASFVIYHDEKNDWYYLDRGSNVTNITKWKPEQLQLIDKANIPVVPASREFILAIANTDIDVEVVND